MFLSFREFNLLCLYDKIIDYVSEKKDLALILRDIGEKYEIRFFMMTKSQFLLSANFVQKPLKDILREIEYLFDLHCEVNENNTIVIRECENFWKSYKINNFFEEDLPINLRKLDNDVEEKSNNEKNSNCFWNSIENSIKKISNDSYVIDRHNCILHVKGNCSVHKRILEYINMINEKQQVLIECKIVEIITNKNENLNFLELIGEINERDFLKITNNIISRLDKMNLKYLIRSTSEIRLLLKNQNTGQIVVTDEMFIFRKTVSKESNSKYYISAPEKLYKFNSGFSLAVVPVIIENNILLKIRPCIRKVLGERGENEIYFQMREIITTLTVPSGKTEIIGGLESNYNETKYSFWSYIPILNRFFSGKRIQKKKSYIILFIKPKIIK
jgi:hypothetical protein